jgi:gamma-glutamyltranspeptidase/glutathione hydrolase
MHTYDGPGRSAAYASTAMCATSHQLGALTANRVLQDGGNAVDAAVAGAVVLGFCEPAMTGLGGDVFAMIHDPATDIITGLNGSGRAPAALDAARLRAEGHATIPLNSVHSVTIPGAVDAFDRLVRDHGRLSLSDVLEPAIRHARSGVPVHRRPAIDWRTFADRLQGDGRRHFLKDGRPYEEGELFTSEGQAQALELIAREGADAFYRGAIMEDMLETLREAGGVHTAEDFGSVEASLAAPISRTYRGHEMIELPPNGQGATALMIAGILERFDIGSLDPVSPERLHLEAEATRLAYAARNRLIGDPGEGALDLSEMLSDQSLDALANSIDPMRAQPDREPRAEALHRDTVYITVVDGDGLAVSLIYSTFWPFGSGLASKRFGISLHNRGAGFSLEEGHVNTLRGGKRPLHTLIPGFMRKAGEYVMPFGVMGGAYQATGHAHFVCNLVDYGMDPQAAIDDPRSFFDISTGGLGIEKNVPEQTAARLAEMGHNVARVPIGMGGAQAIRRDWRTGILCGGTDPRKDGVALGY